MRSQKTEIDSLQLQLAQSAQKIRSSVERELRETFQTVKDERDQLRDVVKNLECDARDQSEKLAAVSEELRRGREELQQACAQTEDLKLELSKKNDLISQESDKVTVLERQLDTKAHHCNDLEREINHLRRKLEEQTRSKKTVAVQTLPDSVIAEQDSHITCLEDKLVATERRMKDALDQLSRTAKERDALRGQLNDVTENSLAMQLKLDNSSAAVSSLEYDLTQSAEKISRLERTAAEKEQRNQLLELAADEMKSTIGSLTAENAVLKQRVKQQSDGDRLSLSLSDLEQKNSELKAEVCSLKDELRTKPGNDREILLQKDEVIAQLQLELDAERRVNRQRQRDGAERSQKEGSTGKKESSGSKASKSSASLDRLKKQHEAELRESENRCSELTSRVDGLKRELRELEVCHQQKVSKLEENVADLTSKLSSAERRACRLEKTRISLSTETAERDVQTCDDISVQPSNILSLMQKPIGNEQVTALVSPTLASSDMVGDVSDPCLPVGCDRQQLVTALQSRVCELEKSSDGKQTDGHDRKLVCTGVCLLSDLALDVSFTPECASVFSPSCFLYTFRHQVTVL